MTTLEKIREEIKQKRDNVPIESDVQQAIACGLDLALQIVEKYAEQEPCEDCDYSEIMDWEQDAKTGKSKPIYWCERHKEPCDDAISRQAVLEIAKQHTLTNDYLAIQNLPSVTQEPKTANWINKEFRKEEYVLTGKCSVCGRVRVIDEYCSNCGACMKDGRTLDEFIEDSKESEDNE